MSEPQQINSEISTLTTQNNVEGMEIDLREIFRRIISIRKTLYKAAIIGLVIGIIVMIVGLIFNSNKKENEEECKSCPYASSCKK